ncbi:putative immunoglobulin-blocking virulence protein [Metamycoplasma equirhinis]|uniref:putative immunoglobulin-blocking virulence protein n=1 Tax=Metamycoplasma equirhinis TaxID=92402 RepID=UPI0035930600
MNFLKTKKSKIIFSTLLSVTGATVGVSSATYFINSDSRNNYRGNTTSNLKPNIINKENLDTEKSFPSNSDENLKELDINKLKPKPTPQPIPNPQLTPKENPMSETEKEPLPIPTPPKPDTNPNLEENEELIYINGVWVKAKVEKPRPREYTDYDKKNQLSNPNPYTAYTTGEVKSIEVTEELRNKTIEKLQNEGLNGLVSKEFFELFEKDEDYNNIEQYFKNNNQQVWQKLLDRYYRILQLSPDKILKFIKESKKEEFKNLSGLNGGSPKWKNETHRKYWIIKNFDTSKFNKLGGPAEEYLKKGLTPDPYNLWVDENGNINSYSYSPPDEHNQVKGKISRDNQDRRVFGFKYEYPRSPRDTEEGNYPGWKKKDVTGEFHKYGIESGDGFKVTELTREKEEAGKLNKGYVIDIDAYNPKGYQKVREIIKKLKEANVEITGYRIHNMGKGNANQSFRDILRELPENLPLLELFFDASSTNTSSLIELENKKIKELSLYTLGNSLLEEWSINPNALKNVEWVNTNDHNVSFDYKQGSEIATRISFNSLAFDPVDFNNNASSWADKVLRINNGLRRAYWARNNETIFQGQHGSGLKPDHNEQGNSYPQGLDLSRVPELRSLRGLIFRDTQKSSNYTQRKLRRLKLYSRGTAFETTALDLDEAGFAENLVIGEPVPPKTKILFSDSQTSKVRISGTKKLSSSGLNNLSILFQYGEVLRSIEVDENAHELREQLKSAGFKVETKTDGDFV